MAQVSSRSSERLLICENRRARHNYMFEQTLEAGIVLCGTEVKSLRAGKGQISEAFIVVQKNEAWLIGAHFDEYKFGNRLNHEPKRMRKLLLHRREIENLHVRLGEKGFTAIPLAMYFKGGRVKIEIGIGKGKKDYDRRDTIKEREDRREIERAVRNALRS